jgi:4-hydroxy-4-methyl-2-oxoglutarate aldolase
MDNKEKDLKDLNEKKELSGIVPENRIYQFDFPRPSQEIIKRYQKIEDLTSGISDLLDEKGIRGAIPASILRPVIPGKRIVGPAITLKHLPERKTVTQKFVDHDESKLGGISDARKIAKPGDVLVCDGEGRAEVSGQGYLAALLMKKKGLAGTILDCGTRDVEGIKRIDYPTWARGITPVSGRHRFEAYEINGPIVCAGIQVQPGDLIVADESGVVVVPASLIEEILVELEQADDKEREQERAILKS